MTRSIAFFATHAAGGVRELWADLGAGFAERGDTVQLLGLYPHEPEPKVEPGTLVWRYMIDERPATLAAKVRLLTGLAAWLRRNRPDVIVTAIPAANVLVPAFARVFSPRSRVIVTHHTPVDTHNRLLNALDGWVGRLGNVRAIVGVSRAVTDSLSRKSASYRAKSRTLHNALPRRISAALSAAAIRRPERPRGRTAVANGRLAPQKNYPMLLKAAAAMRDVHVEIVGGGPDEAALVALAEQLGVTDRVTFRGQCGREAALDIVAQADVFVQVSLYEGHSLALLEAASLGLPLIVSDVPSQTEAITADDGTPCGIAVGLNDDHALADAVQRLLDDPDAYALWAERAIRLGREATFERMLAGYQALVA